jgi:hypothetical protein
MGGMIAVSVTGYWKGEVFDRRSRHMARCTQFRALANAHCVYEMI